MSEWYKTGTVAVTNGSKNVVGTSTLWSNSVRAGDIFMVMTNGTTATGVEYADRFYEIASVTDNMHLTLVENYTQVTGTGLKYAVIRNFDSTTNATIASKIVTMLDKWSVRDAEISAWAGGTITGGTNGDGNYPITDMDGVVHLLPCPAKIVSTASGGGAVVSGGTVANAIPKQNSIGLLSQTSWLIEADGTMNAQMNALNKYTFKSGDITQAGNNIAINMINGNYFKSIALNPVTISISNPPAAGKVGVVNLEIKNGTQSDLAITQWPTGSRHQNATPATTTLKANTVTILSFMTSDGGSSYFVTAPLINAN